MKKVTLIASMLLLGSTLAFAGKAGDVTIVGKTGDNINSADGIRAKAAQQLQSVNVVGDSKAGDITVVGETGDNRNIADGAAAEATQQVQSVNIAE